MQERLGAAMQAPSFERVAKNTGVLIESAKALGLPVLVTEQYPKGLGPTLPALRDALPPEAAPVAKTAFSCVAVDDIMQRLDASGRKQVIVAGMETHVCVFQTVRDLAAHGFQAFVVRDAVLSRTPENHEVGLQLMRETGATISSTEVVVFDLLGQAGTPEFKKLSPLIK
jgi:nicotinamidase-related amidase